VSLIGLGAIGVTFANQIQTTLPGSLTAIADADRIARYTREGIYCNGKRCDFSYITPEEKPERPADLVLIAVKYGGLQEAIEAIRNHVGPDTVILSLLNGISSEEMVGAVYGEEKVLLSVAQGMDAVKVGGHLTYQNMGKIVFGDREPGVVSEKTRAVADFFTRAGVPHEVQTHMKRHLWSKFMLNVGINQVTAVYRCNYAGVQEGGAYRQLMLDAMREVLRLSDLENAGLVEEDIGYWMNVMAGLAPEGKTSMQQDVEAGRKTEVELFAGTVLRLAEKHGIDVPVNRALYEEIRAIERANGHNA
jgi:2-dehydropantoate 2-reductase